MKIKDIKPNPRNPRTITEPALVNLAQSIKLDPEFMRLRPIVVDGNGMILGGNQRYRAIKEKLGMTDIPDDWITRADDLTEEQRKRFVVVDNSPDGLSGEWDFEVLEDDWELPELEDWGFEVQGIPGGDDIKLDPVTYADGKEERGKVTITFPEESRDDIMEAIQNIEGVKVYE